MGGDVIRIRVTQEEIKRRQGRMRAAIRGERVLPLPLDVGFGELCYLPMQGISLDDFYRDPETMFRAQITAAQFVLENIDCDVRTPSVGVPFGTAEATSALGCEVVWREGSRPTTRPWVRTEQDLLRLEKLDPVRTGLRPRILETRQAMLRLKGKYRMAFEGGEPFDPAENVGLNAGSEGPFTLACEISGQTEFFLDLYERPDFAKRLLEIVTAKEIAWIEFAKKETSQPHADVGIMDDLAPFLSAEMYEEFALPYARRIREHFSGGCCFHFCVLADHLLKYLRDDLKITNYYGFKPKGHPRGFPSEMTQVLAELGNRICLTPDPDPVRISGMSYQEIYDVMLPIAKALSPYKGCRIVFGPADGVYGEALLAMNAVAAACRDAVDGHEPELR